MTAIWGLPGYTFKGIYKEIQNHLGSSTQNYIVAARTAQGYDDWHNSTKEERLEVVKAWQGIQVDLAKEKELARQGSFHAPQGFMKTRHLSFDERKKLAEEKKGQPKKNKKLGKSKGTGEKLQVPEAPKTTSRTQSRTEEFEEAIKASVAATSKGDPEEDRMIENAIRASVTELQAAEKEGDDHDAVSRAIRASVEEAVRARKPQKGDGASDHPHDPDEQLTEALRRSVTQEEQHPLADADFDDSGIDTDDDENYKAAIALSKASSKAVADDDDRGLDDKELTEAIKASEKSYAQDQELLERKKTDEDIVMEYIKKQSLEESQYKGAIGATTSKEKEKEKEAS